MIKKRCVTEYANYLMNYIEQIGLTELTERETKTLLRRITRIHFAFQNGEITIHDAMSGLSEIGMNPGVAASKYLG